MVPHKQRDLLVIITVFGLLLATVNKVEALGIVTNSIQFNGITLSGSDQTTAGTTSAWQIDASEESSGWNVSVSATDFVNQETGVISASNLDVRLLDENISIISGDSGPVSTQSTFTPIGSSDVKIVSSAAGQGMGVYEITPDFQLHIPAQVYTGIYASTITVSVVSGP